LDLIERLLDFDPDTRITVDKALSHPYLKIATPELPTTVCLLCACHVRKLTR